MMGTLLRGPGVHGPGCEYRVERGLPVTTLLPGATFSVNGTNPAVAASAGPVTWQFAGQRAGAGPRWFACPIQNVTSTAHQHHGAGGRAPVNAGTDGPLAACSGDAPWLFGSWEVD